MLDFSAFTPHPQLLIPTIGKQHLESLVATRGAMDHLAEELYAAHPDTILVISGHGPTDKEAFSANLHEHYGVDLREFGDFTASADFSSDPLLVDRLQRACRRFDLPFTLFSDPILDYGSAVPLLILAERLPHVRIVPVSFCNRSPKEHFAFGRAMKDVAHALPRRVAVLATGDLSHALNERSPAGRRKEGAAFDETVRQALRAGAVSQLLSIPESTVKKAAECGYRPLLILLGMLDTMNVHADELTYEAPLGVGYLVVHLRHA